MKFANMFATIVSTMALAVTLGHATTPEEERQLAQVRLEAESCPKPPTTSDYFCDNDAIKQCSNGMVYLISDCKKSGLKCVKINGSPYCVAK
jgi:hypothetical protein